eukprot:gnl/MRDRNA2_/MRDRNA2_61455_c0_seq2.p1 gnl/MRDRNA2_/MRDRNA2_61455_c0~~gnl/MRDRNA2_/MRDRNA2_61455_c0_seq2.p1  ORF type:complete len:399 (+),score=83.37 gnl/MRDRNA2_/MRDRNA2_61455_c0_seq2:124-1197(+)
MASFAYPQQYLEQAAITSTGVVLDLCHARPVYFEHGNQSSPGEKDQAKEFHRMLHAAQIAHAGDEIDLGYRYSSLGESVKMWIRTWPGIGMDESEVHMAIACRHLRRMAWFEYKTDVLHASDGVYQVDDKGIVHKEARIDEDGPALTSDGVVVDLDGGHKMFFSHSKEMSPSHEAKEKAKEDFRMMRATQLGHYIDEVLMGHRVPEHIVLCVDDTGVVCSDATVEENVNKAIERVRIQRKKVIHRKKCSIGRTMSSIEEKILVLDENGVVQAVHARSLKIPHTSKKHVPFQSLGVKSDDILCVDISGMVHTGKGFKTPPEIEGPEDAPRLLPEPDAELSPQNPGASPPLCELPEVCI